MNKTFTINDAISIGNALIAVIPKLMVLAWFIAMLVMTVRILKTAWARQPLSTLDLAGFAIAAGVGGGLR